VSNLVTAICYRADGSRKWATLLPTGTELPATTLEDGDTLWPYVVLGQEKDGRHFAVPVGGPLKGPMEANECRSNLTTTSGRRAGHTHVR
jgi:hypothetical protein